MAPTLSEAAKARIEIVRADAEAALQNSITDFFNRCKQPGYVERELNRKPFSIDLVPFFQTYAAAVFRAEAEEWLTITAIESGPDVARHGKRLNRLIDAVVKRITGRVVNGIAASDSVWWQVVEASSKTVDMGVWSSVYRDYKPKDFQHPHSTPLKGTLRHCLVDAKKEAWTKLAAKGGQSINPTIPAAEAALPSKRDRRGAAKAVSQHPKRAAWLSERLQERSWNKHDPLRQGGPDPKTVQKILNGFAVRPDVLEKLAKALGQKHSKVNVLDIPQD
jgi:hypothetical protein